MRIALLYNSRDDQESDGEKTAKWNKKTKTISVSDTVKNGHKITYLIKFKIEMPMIA